MGRFLQRSPALPGQVPEVAPGVVHGVRRDAEPGHVFVAVVVAVFAVLAGLQLAAIGAGGVVEYRVVLILRARRRLDMELGDATVVGLGDLDTELVRLPACPGLGRLHAAHRRRVIERVIHQPVATVAVRGRVRQALCSRLQAR